MTSEQWVDQFLLRHCCCFFLPHTTPPPTFGRGMAWEEGRREGGYTRYIYEPSCDAPLSGRREGGNMAFTAFYLRHGQEEAIMTLQVTMPPPHYLSVEGLCYVGRKKKEREKKLHLHMVAFSHPAKTIAPEG